ncbi:hypothetical protein GH714_012377 [Hevea brasiliensis]|uniref:WPP domain-containing protein n=1 Tax=Hevea brasiliensis TaxID=3981 RepID=A0A6A6NGN9_HEVBR|nr:hypothetical protein GH714_012377 [Hevea brasiliensis]
MTDSDAGTASTEPTPEQDLAPWNRSHINKNPRSLAAAATSAEEDGLEILQLYSKEISRRMLETVKARPRSDSAVDNGVSGTLNAEVASTEAASEEISDSVGTEA